MFGRVEEMDFGRRSSNGRMNGEKLQESTRATLLHADDNGSWQLFGLTGVSRRREDSCKNTEDTSD